jgi:hypothetical protein
MKITTSAAVYTVKKTANKDDNTVSLSVYRNKDKMPLFGTRLSANTTADEAFKWVKLNIEKAEAPPQIDLRKIFNL